MHMFVWLQFEILQMLLCFRLATEAKLGSMLMEPGQQRKIEMIDDHLGMVRFLFSMLFFIQFVQILTDLVQIICDEFCVLNY